MPIWNQNKMTRDYLKPNIWDRIMGGLNKNIVAVGVFVAFTSTSLGISYLYNRALINGRIVSSPEYIMISETKGFGYTEYTKYKDGSQDIKEYPSFRFLVSADLIQDLNGDGKADRIRIEGPKWESHKLHKLTEILVRESDYNSHKEDFDLADKSLAKSQAKFKELKQKW